MAANEKQFRSEIAESFRAIGAHVVVLSGNYIAGIPDLHVAYEGSIMWMELKFGLKTDLTPLQRSFITKENAAGGSACWLRCVPQKDFWQLFGSMTDLDNSRATNLKNWIMSRQRGEKWDPIRILKKLES